MKKLFIYRLALLLIANALFLANVYGTAGNNGTATFNVTPSTEVTVGEIITLSVNVTGITNGTQGEPHGSATYTITIPAGIINADGSEIESNTITNSVSGTGGNRTHQHGEFTATTPGIFTFGFVTTTGTNGNSTNSINVIFMSSDEASIMAAAPTAFRQLTNTSDTSTVNVFSHLLTEAIDVQLEDESGFFSINTEELPEGGGEIEITFNPTELGTFTAKLTLTSGTVSTEVNISGTAIPLTVEGQVANFEFEIWDNIGTTSIEPVGWNSFMTNAGTQATAARAQQVNIYNNVRPGSQGNRSAVINARSVMGITANGNLTTGQIQANSTSAAALSNHNKTIRANPNHSMPFTWRPDTLTIWVNAVIGNGEYARISAIIHGDYDYRDPSGSDPNAENYVVGKAVMNFPSVGGWQRLSIPFDYESYAHNDVEPAYILISITTNETPGGGSGNDRLFIDDMLMIFTPTLAVENTSGTNVFASGEELEVTFTLTGTMSPYNLIADANVVSLELSDAYGSFENPTVLATDTTDVSGVFTVQLPCELSTGDYSIRVVTTNFPMISDTINISVNAMPEVSISGDTLLTCSTQEVTLTVTPSGEGYEILWCTDEYTESITVYSPGTFFVTVTNLLTGCSAIDSIVVTRDISTPDISISGDTLLVGASLTLSVVSTDPATTYEYFWNTEETTNSITIYAPGDYWVRVTNPSTGCYSYDTITVSISTFLDPVFAENNILVYPNPVSTTLFVESAITIERAVIYTLSGVKVAEIREVNNGIDVSGFANGLYLIIVEMQDGSTYRTLFVKN